MPSETLPIVVPRRPATDKWRILGQKRPLALKHIWSIRDRLEMAYNMRDPTLFNTAIDRKLRVCDLVGLKVHDAFATGHVKNRASVTQSMSGKPVRLEITGATRHTLERWIADPEMTGSEFLWPSRLHARPHLSPTQFARIRRE